MRETRLGVPGDVQRRPENTYIAPVRVDDDLLPTTNIAVRLTRSQKEVTWIVGEIALEELWKMVDKIRVGQQGYALIVGDDGRLIAHGNPDERRHIADTDQNRVGPELKFAEEFRASIAASRLINGHVVSISVGVSELRHGQSPVEWVLEADLALYHAKDAGRNRVIGATANTGGLEISRAFGAVAHRPATSDRRYRAAARA